MATSGLMKQESPCALTVSRGISNKHGTAERLFNEFKNAVGETFTDPAFVSTNTNHQSNYGTQAGGLHITIHVPEGSPGAYLGGMSQFVHEHEFLLPPGMTFKVLRAWQDASGKRQVALGMMEVPPEDKAAPKPVASTSSQENESRFLWEPTSFVWHNPERQAAWDKAIAGGISKSINAFAEMRLIADIQRMKAQAHDPHSGQFVSGGGQQYGVPGEADRKSTRLNSSHTVISYAVFCLKKKKYSLL